MSTFKERNRELQELVRELAVVRNHNLGFKPGDDQSTLLMFAEAALVLTAMERFLRVILAGNATDADTLPNLLEKATSTRIDLIRFPPAWDRNTVIKQVKDVRNTLLHGNYEQAAQRSGCASTSEYFQKQFAPEIETLTQFLDGIMKQIDPDTGQRRP